MAEQSDEGFIFTRAGSFIDPEYFSRWMALPLIKKATGGRIRRFHDMRHFFVSMLIEQKEDAKTIQDQVGHASIQTTFDVYGHLLSKSRQESAERLEKSLFGANVRTLLDETGELRGGRIN